MESNDRPRRAKAQKRTSVRISERLMKAVRVRAQRDDRTVTAQLERYISAQLAADKGIVPELEVRNG